MYFVKFKIRQQEKIIDESEGSGLTDYMLAAAAEKIAKVDLKKNKETFWDSADTFSEQWKKHLHRIPGTVEEIANSQKTIEQKNRELVELGTPAVPFILQQIEAGNEALFPAVEELLSENRNSKIDQSKKSTAEILKLVDGPYDVELHWQ